MGSVTLLPHAAAERICHDEQMVIWANDVVGALAVAGFVRDGMSYDDVLEIHDLVKRELRSVVEAALDHPEAKTTLSAGKRL